MRQSQKSVKVKINKKTFWNKNLNVRTRKIFKNLNNVILLIAVNRSIYRPPTKLWEGNVFTGALCPPPQPHLLFWTYPPLGFPSLDILTPIGIHPSGHYHPLLAPPPLDIPISILVPSLNCQALPPPGHNHPHPHHHPL